MSQDALPAEISSYPLACANPCVLRSNAFWPRDRGEMVESQSRQTLPVHEPASGLEFARVASGTGEDVDLAVRSRATGV